MESSFSWKDRSSGCGKEVGLFKKGQITDTEHRRQEMQKILKLA